MFDSSNTESVIPGLANQTASSFERQIRILETDLGWLHTMSFIYRLTFGQLLSLSTSVSSVCSQLALDRAGVSFTAVPSILVYSTLMLWRWKARPRGSYRHLPVLWYATAALADVSANYLIFLAFFFAPVAQISLLEDAAIPISFALDFFWFKRVGKMGHLVGALLCSASIAFSRSWLADSRRAVLRHGELPLESSCPSSLPPATPHRTPCKSTWLSCTTATLICTFWVCSVHSSRSSFPFL